MIPKNELEFSYARSSGPGGQNVNKVNSKVILRWNIKKNKSLPEATRLRFLSQFQTRLSKDGFVVITSDRFRDQIKNRSDCIEKLGAMIKSVSKAPRPRHKTKPSRSSVEKMKTNKQRQSQKKRSRGRLQLGD